MDKRKITKRLSYKNKLIFISISAIISIISITVSDQLAKKLQQKEINEVNLWSVAMSKLGDQPFRDYKFELEEMGNQIINLNNSIPSIITDEKLKVVSYINIPKKIAENPKSMKERIYDMANKNEHLVIEKNNGISFSRYYVFYGNSPTINLLRYFPIITIIVIFIIVFLAYITYNSSKRDEQNKVWIGMAKETAHQLGTPTSSLLGWLEYLKTQDIEKSVVAEMSKDVERLLTVVDRFSKIGSKTVLEPLNVTEIASNTVKYFQHRIPKKVTLTMEAKIDSPLIANANEVLFGWVLENLLRNAVDAVCGEGAISVITHCDKKWIYVDVIDSGKGISPSVVDKIFNPGFTTKARGWGLGLSLSYRIMKQYHKGDIFVQKSAIDKGTTMCVMIKRQ